MKALIHQLPCILPLLFTTTAFATTHYVDLNSTNPIPPFADWSTAATNIQDAVNAASPGDQLLVNDGVYQTGAVSLDGTSTNRVAINKAITVQSVHGPAVTVIQGSPPTFHVYAYYSTNAVRCVYLAANAVLSGFTLTNGATSAPGDGNKDQSGGGAWCEDTSAILTNCVVTGNYAYNFGGGVFSGTLENCILSGNEGSYLTYASNNITYGPGGGAYGSTLSNCVVAGNISWVGGGAANCTLYQCLVSNNTVEAVIFDLYGFGGGLQNCTAYGCQILNNHTSANCGGAYSCVLNNCLISGNDNAGTFYSTLYNCTVVNNAYGVYSSTLYNSISYFNANLNYSAATFTNSCTTPAPDTNSSFNTITNDPMFVATNVFLLSPGSPCIDTGDNDYVTTTTDINGNPRIINGTVDMGAYEFQNTPLIAIQPVGQTVPVGTNVSLTAIATGVPAPGYQWFYNGTALTDGSHYSGSIGTNLQIFNAQTSDTGNYFVVASNTLGITTSLVAVVTVMVPPTITTQPASQSILQGSNVTFTAAVSGDAPLGYLWSFNGQPLTNGGQFSGTATTNLTISNIQPPNSGSYTLLVTNPVGSAVSTGAVLTVLSPPSFTQEPPSSQNIDLGSNIVISTSVFGTAPLAYQWSFNGGPITDGGRISGSMMPVLNIANSQTNDAGLYQLIVTNNYGAATSIVSTLTIQLPIEISGQPTNQTVLVGNSAPFTVSASGFVPPNYLWYSNGVALSNSGRISGATNATLTISSLQTNDTGTAFQVVVTNIYGALTSSVATVTALAPAQITRQPVTQSALLGTNVTFSIIATGSALTYQWFDNGVALSDGGRITGSATPVLTISNVQPGDAGGYVAVVTNLLSSARSSTASLTPQAVLSPSTRYVALTSTNPLSPYLDWSTAATNIQDAIDASVNGDLVLVSNGVYATGGRVVYGSLTNRVVINKALTVQSVNGAAATAIQGNQRLGNSAVRCVYLTNNAALVGFTLTNGGTRQSGDPLREQSGGGAWCESTNSSQLLNCVLISNASWNLGGGIYSGYASNSVIRFNGQPINAFSASGGGAYGSVLDAGCALVGNYSISGGGTTASTLNSCLVSNNTAKQNLGGGAFGGTLSNCTVIRNYAQGGGGIAQATAINSVITSNSASANGGGAYSGHLIGCTVSWNSVTNVNGISTSGGGTYNSTVTYCVLENNSSARLGGGAYEGTLTNSIVGGNTASQGGGVGLMTTANCIIIGNFATNSGGGAYAATLNNCTVVENSSGAAGGTSGGILNNCVVFYNSATNGSNYVSGTFNFSCTAPLPSGGRNITNDPALVNLNGGDFHLQSTSPCINSGNNAYVTVASDFDGNPRIVGGTVDIGAYEYQTPTSVISYAWLQQYGLPTDGSVDYADLDGTSFNVYQDWIAGLDPTNVASVLVMQTPQPSTNSTGITVTWLSVNNRTYYLQQATNLALQPAFSTIQSNIAGQAGTTSFTDTTATNGGPYFYRVGVQQ